MEERHPFSLGPEEFSSPPYTQVLEMLVALVFLMITQSISLHHRIIAARFAFIALPFQ